ncbi:MAG: hypothetical protein WC781_00195 [Candidatus Pacearchaeota archaeon]|jgi:hypothetical protein
MINSVNPIDKAYNPNRIGYLVLPYLIERVNKTETIKVERRDFKVHEIQATYYPGLENRTGERLNVKV